MILLHGEYTMEDIRTMYSSVKVHRKQEEKERAVLRASEYLKIGLRGKCKPCHFYAYKFET